MDRFNKMSGGFKAVLTVTLVLALTGALVLLAAEKPAAEKAERAFLGVSVRGLDDGELEELGLKYGVRVAAVEKESAAAKAGVQEKDIILSVNNEKVRSPRTLTGIIRELAPGSAVRLGLRRQGKDMEVKAVLGKYERPRSLRWKLGPMTRILEPTPYLGVNIMDLDDDLAAYFSVKAGEGILVTKVEKDTAAAKAGLKSGDVIVQMGDKAIRKTGDIHKALAELKKGDSVTMTVMRRGKKETLKATPDHDRQRRVLRFFKGDKDMELRHLELPELDFTLQEFDVRVPEPPEPPDAEEIELRIHKKLEHAHEQLEQTSEKLDQAKIKIEKRLKRIGENYWI